MRRSPGNDWKNVSTPSTHAHMWSRRVTNANPLQTLAKLINGAKLDIHGNGPMPAIASVPGIAS